MALTFYTVVNKNQLYQHINKWCSLIIFRDNKRTPNLMGMVIMSEWGWIVRSLDCRPSWSEDSVVWSREGIVWSGNAMVGKGGGTIIIMRYHRPSRGGIGTHLGVWFKFKTTECVIEKSFESNCLSNFISRAKCQLVPKWNKFFFKMHNASFSKKCTL